MSHTVKTSLLQTDAIEELVGSEEQLIADNGKAAIENAAIRQIALRQ